MDECPFLTTGDEKVECFKECIFFKENSKQSLCPFKRIELRKKGVSGIYAYNLLKDDENDIIEHYKKYVSSNF